MLICGLKITHDGAVSLSMGNELLFSIELEKVANNERYSAIRQLDQIADILEANGYAIEDVDRFVVDGWHPTGEYGDEPAYVKSYAGNEKIKLEVAGYIEDNRHDNLLKPFTFNSGLIIKGKSYPYVSYNHVANHLMSAYSTSPFAKHELSSYVLVWDGGMYPRLYYYDATNHTVVNHGHLFTLLGHIYEVIAIHFGPYKKPEDALTEANINHRLELELIGEVERYESVAGKIMSYIAIGEEKSDLLAFIQKAFDESPVSNMCEHELCLSAKEFIKGKEYSDADVLRTFHAFVENLLVESLRKKVASFNLAENPNFCFVGGCALNIKWNSAIRNSGVFKETYIPPFPNDSGSSLGAVCNEIYYQTGYSYIHWSVYQGPAVLTEEFELPLGWSSRACTTQQLAQLMHEENEPVVVLNNRAELGPRALGNRSILAPPVSAEMKKILNFIKKRERFRPVAPICIESDSKAYFSPGGHDPFMLYDHQVLEHRKSEVPAICHLDGTARLQTISKEDNPFIHELLEHYMSLSGIPMLCNTSANLNGSGFFPDVKSVLEWDRVNYVWSKNKLYFKVDKISWEDI